jgi:hypothetical protein
MTPRALYYSRAGKGGHLAAWEQPQIFAQSSGRRSSRCVEGQGMPTSIATMIFSRVRCSLRGVH